MLYDDNLDKTFIPHLQREITAPHLLLMIPVPLALKGFLVLRGWS